MCHRRKAPLKVRGPSTAQQCLFWSNIMGSKKNLHCLMWGRSASSCCLLCSCNHSLFLANAPPYQSHPLPRAFGSPSDLEPPWKHSRNLLLRGLSAHPRSSHPPSTPLFPSVSVPPRPSKPKIYNQFSQCHPQVIPPLCQTSPPSPSRTLPQKPAIHIISTTHLHYTLPTRPPSH